jgi:hypothetical protein
MSTFAVTGAVLVNYGVLGNSKNEKRTIMRNVSSTDPIEVLYLTTDEESNQARNDGCRDIEHCFEPTSMRSASRLLVMTPILCFLVVE